MTPFLDFLPSLILSVVFHLFGQRTLIPCWAFAWFFSQLLSAALAKQVDGVRMWLSEKNLFLLFLASESLTVWILSPVLSVVLLFPINPLEPGLSQALFLPPFAKVLSTVLRCCAD